jgi:selenophosphate synthetase-related protein
MAPGPVLSARGARAGDCCCLLVNISGHFHRHYPFWDAATNADPQLLRSHLDLLVQLAAAGLCHGAKDISMGGVAGTAVMLAEAAGCALDLNLDAITPADGVELMAWLSCFPSYGYLLVVDPSRLEDLAAAVAPYRDLRCEEIGRFGAGPARVQLSQGGATASLWQMGEALTGF